MVMSKQTVNLFPTLPETVKRIPHDDAAMGIHRFLHYNNAADGRIATRGETKQDRQCTYNVTPKNIRVTFVAVEKQSVLHILIVSL